MQDERNTWVPAYGNNTAELEAEALKAARKIFSEDVPLVVDRSYLIVNRVASSSLEWPAGVKVFASINVQVAPGVINPAFLKPTGRFESWWRRTFWIK